MDELIVVIDVGQLNVGNGAFQSVDDAVNVALNDSDGIGTTTRDMNAPFD